MERLPKESRHGRQHHADREMDREDHHWTDERINLRFSREEKSPQSTREKDKEEATNERHQKGVEHDHFETVLDFVFLLETYIERYHDSKKAFDPVALVKNSQLGLKQYC